MAYRPTSLDFINRPNPVEPQSVQQNHPLNDAPRLEQSSKEEFPRLLWDNDDTSPSEERPSKRRKSGDARPKVLNLPRPPAVKSHTKRMLIPPTLSGLHQPPPDAGLLPSISTGQPVRDTGRSLANEADAAPKPTSAAQETESHARAKPSPKAAPKDVFATPTSTSKRNKWSEEETAQLLKGVARFGMGNWTRILKCTDYTFESRTAIDLKDRFRVCCPDEYAASKKPKRAVHEQSSEQVQPSDKRLPEKPASSRLERKSSVELRKMGIEEPFSKSKRRPRTAYSKEEDDALLEGFEKYGNSWASIQQDEALRLSHRQPTDLRDRFRTKHPERYKQAGLAPRPEVFPKKPDRRRIIISTARQEDSNDDPTSTKDASNVTTAHDHRPAPKEMESNDQATSGPPKPAPITSLLPYDDVFWGAPFSHGDNEFDRPTLDRQILDWPLDIARPAPTTSSASINPLVTVKPPVPRHNYTDGRAVLGGSQSSGALPSLAAITATAGSDGDFMEHLELPELVGVLGDMGYESNKGGQIPSLEELMS
ncbi:uncharacterized protein LTR77_009953 [Saxophila tyrrhenica]|uniref:Uncharacterized protein n=1 Tax=Saxophila tyrrhenica TaxID=1690608 RepID=A0AAV9NWJ3_9PEZI|nr:hypothetical protein LTR77_009953 [Saxophila tyrrhenica]